MRNHVIPRNGPIRRVLVAVATFEICLQLGSFILFMSFVQDSPRGFLGDFLLILGLFPKNVYVQ